MDTLLLQRLIVRNRDSLLKGSISPRELVLPTDLNLIVTLIGVRRCGKTSLLQHTARELVANGVSSDRIVYLNFEDERISADFSASDLVNALLLLNPHVALSTYYLFLDEVQAVSQWEKMVYTLHETEQARLFITGSNSDLLSVEIATALRGRSLSFELFPFSFSEFLSMRSHKSNLLREESRAEMQNLFDEYLKFGGFPDVFSQPNTALRTRILQEYFNAMLYRDMVERYEISSPVTLKYFCKRLVENIGKPTSINKIYNELKSQGRMLTKNVLYEWIDHAQNIYLFQRCPRPVQSLVKQSTGYDKYYGIDAGMMAALSSTMGEHYGRLLENTVFMHLRRRQHTVTYHNGKQECDFLLFEDGKVVAAIQVAKTIRDTTTKERELAGLLDACKAYNLTKGVIVTAYDEERFNHEGVEVEVVPAFEYLVRPKYL